MTISRQRRFMHAALLGGSLMALAACDPDGNFDIDMRNFGNAGLDTTAAANNATQPRPQPDARGVITYPNYQIAVARRGDTVESVAARIGIPPRELASYNAVAPGTVLRDGEVLALPRRVVGGLTPSPVTPGGRIDVTEIASGAIDRAGGTTATTRQPTASGAIAATEPIRHRVMRGETAYSVSRLYNVNVKALADWNGLGPDLAVREGQTLLIPVTSSAGAPREVVTAPGAGSPTPTPPSASKPLPEEKTQPAAAPVATPKQPDLGSQTTAASNSKLAMPVQGKIIRGYQKKKNEGIDIAASAGAAVTAADGGTVAAITKDTDQVPILVIRHEGNLLTVYANIDNIAVAKGAKVSRGQKIATVRKSDPAFVHFEVRQGFDSVDPMPFLQ